MSAAAAPHFHVLKGGVETTCPPTDCPRGAELRPPGLPATPRGWASHTPNLGPYSRARAHDKKQSDSAQLPSATLPDGP